MAGCDARIDHTEDGNEQVDQKHAPARDESEPRVKRPPDVRIGRPRGRIAAGHAAEAHRRADHGAHRDHDRGDGVTSREVVGVAEERQGCDRLDEDDAVDDQVAQAQDPAKLYFGLGRAIGHAVLRPGDRPGLHV